MVEELITAGRRWVRYLMGMPDDKGEFVVDMFAGGGGTSCGIRGALGRDADVAMNHDEHAIAIHKLNHPATHHFLCDVREVNPRQVLPDRPIGLLWLSPDCTHHSRAKGGKPAKRNRRALANVGTVWAAARKPRVIILENVEEFEGWGPLGEDGQPLPDKKGQSFKRWVGRLRRLGYEVQWRSLVAADYGAPTIRKRLFLIARRDGEKIVWPSPSHAPADKAALLGLKPWRAAYECIDWRIPARSIFERKKPLAEATQKRIHAGIFKFVFGGNPFIVKTNHTGEGFRGQSVDDPLRTIVAKNEGHGLVLPFLSPAYNSNGEGNVRAHDLRKPQPTIPSRNNMHQLSEAHLMAIDNSGEFRPATSGIDEPVRTITTENRHALVESFLVKFKGKQGPKDPRKPLDGMTTKPSDGMAAAYLTKASERQVARPVTDPHTAVTSGNKEALATARLEQAPIYYCKECDLAFQDKHATGVGGLAPAECPKCGELQSISHSRTLDAHFLAKNFTGVVGQDLRKPKGAITTKDHDSLVTSHMTTFRGTSKAGRDLRDPVPGLTAGGNHIGEVRAFLVKYFRTGMPVSVRKPAPTLTTKQRLGLVEVQGMQYQIQDICLRMLTPMELLRAQFGKYAEGYQLIGNQEMQVKAIGNSVPPEVAEALVRANVKLRVAA